MHFIVVLGSLLSLGAPVGWMVLEHLFAGSAPFSVYRHVLYIYMAFGTLMAFGGFSLIIGLAVERFVKVEEELEKSRRLVQERLKEMKVMMLRINQFEAEIGRSETEDEVGYKLVRALHVGLGFSGVCLFKREDNYLIVKEAYGTGEDEGNVLDGLRIPIDDPRAGVLHIACVQKRSFIFTKESYIPPEFRLKPPYDRIKPFRVRSFLVVPIVVEDGEPAWGLVTADRKRSGLEVTTFDLNMVELLVDVARTTIKRIRLKEKLELLATTDELTGLYNRRFWMELAQRELDRATRYIQPLSVLMLDIDDFKKINDSFGHHAGDMVLKNLGNTIKKNTRAVDIPGRYGGEEFVVLLPQVVPERGVLAAERLRKIIEDTDMGVPRKVTATFGVSGYLPSEDGRKFLDQILMEADTAMYEGKRKGKNRVVPYWEVKKT